MSLSHALAGQKSNAKAGRCGGMAEVSEQRKGHGQRMMNKSKFDVVVVGSIGVDTNVYLHEQEIDLTVETNFTLNLDSVGGAGGVASRGYAQLGKRTAIIAHVGDDHNGRFVRAELAKDGIDTSALFTDPMGTSRSVNLMYPDGRRQSFYDGKGHMSFKPDMAHCWQILASSRLAHFNLWNWTRHLLPIAKEFGLTIACDLQDVVSPDDPYRQDFIDHAQILFFSSTNHPDPTPLIEQFLARDNIKFVIAGMGSQGSALGTPAGIQFERPSRWTSQSSTPMAQEMDLPSASCRASSWMATLSKKAFNADKSAPAIPVDNEHLIQP